MAGDEPGDGPVRVLVVLLAVLAVVGGFFAAVSWRGGESDNAEGYAAVQRAADRTAMALLNVDYRSSEKTIKAVKATSTADFAKEFSNASDGLIKLTREARSVMTADVIWTGVVRLDENAATVIVATEGDVKNAQTGEKAAARNFRLKLDLVRSNGRWLTSGLDFVKVPLGGGL